MKNKTLFGEDENTVKSQKALKQFGISTGKREIKKLLSKGIAIVFRRGNKLIEKNDKEVVIAGGLPSFKKAKHKKIILKKIKMNNFQKLKTFIKPLKLKSTSFNKRIEEIADFYQVGLIPSKKGSSYFKNSKRIYLSNKLTKEKKCKIFAHELAHHFQNLNFNLKSSLMRTYKGLYDVERKAERLAYFICKEHFPELKLKHQCFKQYLNKRSKHNIKLRILYGKLFAEKYGKKQ